jgi:hypothetical protein
MPYSGVVVYGLPTTDARKKSIHEDELGYFRRKLRGVGVGDHQAVISAVREAIVSSGTSAETLAENPAERKKSPSTTRRSASLIEENSLIGKIFRTIQSGMRHVNPCEVD